MTGLPLAARQIRADLVAIRVWKLMMFKRAVSNNWPWRSDPRDPQERFVREHHVTLWNRVNIAGKSECLEIVQKLGFEKCYVVRSAEFRQIGEVIRLEIKILKIIDGVAQAAGDGVAAVERFLAEREVKDRFMLQASAFSSNHMPW